MQRLGSESSDDPVDFEEQDLRPRTMRECPADLDLPPGSRQTVGAILQELSGLRSRAIERAIRESGLRQPQWRVLAEVARSNGAFQRRLATQLAIGKVRLGAILGTLERAGLISRKSELSDRRIRRVFLTPKAWDVLQRVESESERIADSMVEGITAAEGQKLVGVLEQIRGNLAPLLNEAPSRESLAEDDDGASRSRSLTVEQRLTVLTLGVDDIARSRHFYERALGWTATPPSSDKVVFFRLGGVVLMLLERSLLAQDAGIPVGNSIGGVALTHVVRCREEVDAVIAQANSAGGRMLRPACNKFWGGYSGYFADPDGHAWEVAYTPPDFQLRVDGTMDLPMTTVDIPATGSFAI